MSTPTIATQELREKPSLEAATVAEAFQRTVAQCADKVALRTVGDVVSLTWSDLGSKVREVARALSTLGVEKGDSVALLIGNTVECHVVDYAALHLGAVPFTVYNSSTPEQIVGQLGRVDSRVIVVEQCFLDKALAVSAAMGGLVDHVVVCDAPAGPGYSSLDDLVEQSVDSVFDFEARWRAIEPGDPVTSIFTSGTTGIPKAAIWSHHNVMETLRSLDKAIPMTREGVVSFLPLAHAGGRVTVHYMALAYGSTITACPDMSAAAAHFADAHPDAMLSVPRVFEKFQVGVETFIGMLDDDALQQRILATIELGKQLARVRDDGLVDHLEPEELARQEAIHAEGVKELQPILKRLGLDKLKSAIVGGAPAAPELAQFYRAIGIPFMEAYGSSEASLCIFNSVEAYKSGTAGFPIDNVEIKLASDGELLIRSPFNFVEYRKQPDETAKTVDADGWLHSGDIAEIDDLGYVKIVDRKKEIMISRAGKNMSPANIESAIRGESSLIAQVVAIGDNRRFVTALVAVDPEAVSAVGHRLGLDCDNVAEILSHPAIATEIEAAIERGNRQLSRVEQVKKWSLVKNLWSPGGDELTPTGKLKRRIIEQKYADEIESLYDDSAR